MAHHNPHGESMRLLQRDIDELNLYSDILAIKANLHTPETEIPRVESRKPVASTKPSEYEVYLKEAVFVEVSPRIERRHSFSGEPFKGEPLDAGVRGSQDDSKLDINYSKHLTVGDHNSYYVATDENGKLVSQKVWESGIADYSGSSESMRGGVVVRPQNTGLLSNIIQFVFNLGS